MTLTERLKAYHRAYQTWRASPLESTNGLVVTFVRGVLAAISGTTLSYVLGAITTVWIARELGVSGYGTYATVMASLGLLSNFLGLGLDTWLVSEGGRQPRLLNGLAWQVIYLKAAGAVAMLVILLTSGLGNEANAAVFLLGSLGVIADGFARTGFAMLRARAQNGRVAVLEVAAPALLLIGILVLRTTGFTVVSLVLVQWVCNLVVLAATLASAFGKEVRLPSPTPRHTLRAGWIFIASDVVANLYSLAGVAAVGMFAGAAAAGLYRPAQNMIALSYIVPHLIFLVGLPLLNRAPLPAVYKNIARAMLVGAAAYGLLVFMALWLAGEPILRLIYGTEFLPALPYVHMMSIIPLMKSVSFVCAAVLLSHNRQRLRLLLQSGVMIVSVMGALLIIPQTGAVGAAWLQVGIEALLMTLYAAGALWTMRTRAATAHRPSLT